MARKGPKPGTYKANENQLRALEEGRMSRITHGADSQNMKKKLSDRRTTKGKAIQAALDGLMEDVGGPENMLQGQHILLGVIKSQLIVVTLIGDYINRKQRVVQNGELLPVLRHGFGTHCENLRRAMKEFYDLSKKQPQKAPDLEAYLTERYGEKKDE